LVFIFFVYRRKRCLLVFFIILLGFKNISSVIAIHTGSSQLAEKNKASVRVLSWNVENFINHEKGKIRLAVPLEI